MQVTTMKGAGYYDANSSLQAKLIQSAVPLFDSAADTVRLPEGGALTIVDYGCGEGKNSLACVKTIVDRIRRRKSDLDINVIQNDLWANDFNQLFSSVYQGYAEPGLGSDTSRGANTYFFASGRSFYDQIAASGCVHLGFSTSAVHWLGAEGSIADHIYLSQATASERIQLARVAADRWRAFLQYRALELTSGGKLVVVMLGSAAEPGLVDDAGLWTGETFTGENLMDLMNTVLGELAELGLVSPSRWRKFALPLYCRTTTEALHPLTDPEVGLGRHFKIDCARVQVDPSPLYETYQQSRDSQAYATALMNWMRAWVEPLLTAGLFDPDEISTTAQQQILRELYDRMIERIAKRPDHYACNPIMLYLALTRV